ncbi:MULTISPECIES: class I SAM-dependent methyltransferase [Halolamina]|uniref:Methyltransferase domain-containing protein n=1 Tax=Halolamina pelagica TaxID=699431 RepID=A0A1I5NZ72_9EURY|nr:MULTISPECIES: class I SAM-dependent methyltransferase [Halolamina]NHX36529.1 class I SAM-dependent methyltransferase [Halolamina sp. R1-12]SFP26586.1 Methyltransferase domain-containing protein [Halolamina pelagica]
MPDDPAHAGHTYDRIAAHFSETREYPWPEIESFLDGRSGAVGLDLGCGNGRHAEVLAAHADRVVAVDASTGLLAEAAERAAEHGFETDLVAGDAAAIPLGAGTVDLAVYVATLHHLRPRARRIGSLNELARVLAPGGRALVSAWSTVHDRFADEGTDGSGLDTEVDWTLPGGETVGRFYHVYDPAEFEADLKASELALLEWELSSGNCYAVVGPSE